MFKVQFSSLICLITFCESVLGAEFHINNTNELISFSNDVNSGINFEGTTVFLDVDIDFSGDLSEEFEIIGKSYGIFMGTFDGQGHTISNLAMNSSSQYIELFGYLTGVTIKNIVLDSSCSAVNSYSDSSGYFGGIIGYCQTYNGPCVIENNVNMASVAFTGSTSSILLLGGIAGYLSASNKEVTVRNCVNYGSVTHSGTVSDAYIGGIIGYSSGGSSNKVFIQNCLNYGTITHNGTTTDSLYIGGILGCAWSGINSIENCVNCGKITSNKASNYIYIGSVIGYVILVHPQLSHIATGQVMWGITMFVVVEAQQRSVRQSKLSSTQQQDSHL